MNLTDWLQQITHGATAQEMAEKADLSQRTVQHQVSTGRMSIENKVKIAAAFGYSPLRTLIEWGTVGPEWEIIPDIQGALRLATEEQLADEILRRMKRGLETSTFTDPINEVAARRSNVTGSNVRSLPYAADGSDTEPEPGDDDYADGP